MQEQDFFPCIVQISQPVQIQVKKYFSEVESGIYLNFTSITFRKKSRAIFREYLISRFIGIYGDF